MTPMAIPALAPGVSCEREGLFSKGLPCCSGRMAPLGSGPLLAETSIAEAVVVDTMRDDAAADD